ncbi:ABC transporter permease subunit [Candidatus Bathyarchaeota archaeon A05DMB-2]|jgi:ABC-type transport system involved in multi-copper enzyme maturation permease subunit|nr:ABC transporter permease subunit [Candidatus Bathyarchaeota archaeon A05DMB-2]
MTATNRERPRPSWLPRFWAVVRYEMLWNIRKKKFIGIVIAAFALVTVDLALPAFFNVSENPDFAATFSVGNLVFFLIALVTVMNSISGEFESGTIVPLLTKPVSRTTVFLAKLFAAFVIIIVTYTVLFIYSTVGGIVVYGPQDNLQLVPLALIGNVISTFVWVAIILAIGSISKSSLFAALGGLVLFIAFVFAGSIIASVSNEAGALNYVPGGGATGALNVAQRSQNITIQNITVSMNSISTGTDNIGTNLVNYARYPSATVNITRTDVFSTPPKVIQLYTESIGLIALRSIAVAFAYILVFLFIAWFAFKRAQILE